MASGGRPRGSGELLVLCGLYILTLAAAQVNYAAMDAGALTLGASPGLKGASNLLDANPDRYAIAPCDAEEKWVEIGLSEDIMLESVSLASYEMYSGAMREIRLLGSTTFPPGPQGWKELAIFEAKQVRGEQRFKVSAGTWARYVKLEFLSFHGSEYYCTLSEIRVFGQTLVENLKTDLDDSLTAEELNQQVADMTADLVGSEGLRALDDGGEASQKAQQGIDPEAGKRRKRMHVQQTRDLVAGGDAEGPRSVGFSWLPPYYEEFITPFTEAEDAADQHPIWTEDAIREAAANSSQRLDFITSPLAAIRLWLGADREASRPRTRAIQSHAGAAESCLEADESEETEPSPEEEEDEPEPFGNDTAQVAAATPKFDAPAYTTTLPVPQSVAKESKDESKAAIADAAAAAPKQDASLPPQGEGQPNAQPKQENGAAVIAKEQPSAGEAAAVSLASCLGNLNLGKFRNITMTRLQAAEASKKSGTDAIEAAVPPSDFDSIFKKLMKMVKGLEFGHSILDQYLAMAHGCYKEVIVDLIGKLDVQTEISRKHGEEMKTLREEMSEIRDMVLDHGQCYSNHDGL
uniref:SUN domain-containing protein n=1 Tax=Pinguiococcus pyrenoidosus TaxID=172671 RepID=A0A7R9U5V6_9STRA|mmetsp:Transcript_15910/g.60621  ORF Transcript_15910/g.60621 Transcript_15910/m.60621 type:complete len:577 (+) Transcript_15910:60-1790(+)